MVKGIPLSEEQFELVRQQCADSHSDFARAFLSHTSAVFCSLRPFGSQAVSFLRSLNDDDVIIQQCEKHLAEIDLSPEAKETDSSSELCLALYLALCLESETANPLPFLLPLLNSVHRRQVMLDLIMYSKKHPKLAEKQAGDFIRMTLSKGPDMPMSDFLVLSSALEIFMPIFPSSMKSIYMLALCKRTFLSQALTFLKKPDVRIAKSILSAVSASCIDEESRKFNTEAYLPFLIAGSEVSGSGIVTSLSLLCIVKLWSFSQIEEQISLLTVVQKTIDGFKSVDATDKAMEYFLEALAYLSLGNSARSALRADEDFLEHLLLVLETTKDGTNVYGALLVYLNLSKVKDPAADKDTDTINYLKSVSVPGNDNTKDDERSISLFNESLVLEHKLITSLSGLSMTQGNVASQILRIIHNLALNPKREIQREIVAQGGLSIILKYLTQYSLIDKDTKGTVAVSSDPNVVQTRIFAIRALATICRSVDPKLAFSKYDIKSSVPFLVELLGLGLKEIEIFQGSASSGNARIEFASQLTILDKLYGLLALTNLSSMPDNALHVSIINRTFESYLKDLMLDTSLSDIQKATWELINNLIANPLMLAKFFNPENADSVRNLTILVKMLHSKSESLQIVIAGLLANATMEFELVAQVIMTNTTNVFVSLMEIVADILQKQAHNDDLIIRVCTFVLNLVEVAEGHKLDCLSKFQEDKAFKLGLKTVVISTKNPDIMLTIRGIIETAQLKF